MQDFLALATGLLWKSEFEIAHSDAAQFGMEKVNAPGDADAESASQWARQDADKFDQQPSERVFESVAQGAEEEPCHGFSGICADKANAAKSPRRFRNFPDLLDVAVRQVPITRFLSSITARIVNI